MDPEMTKAVADALNAWLDDDDGWDVAEAIKDPAASDRAQGELFIKQLEKVGFKVVPV